MFGLIILVIIIFAIRQHHRSKKLKWRDQYWKNDEFRKHIDDVERFASEFPHRLAAKIQQQAQRSGSQFERKMAEKFERETAKWERKLRNRLDRETRKWGRPPWVQPEQEMFSDSTSDVTAAAAATTAGADDSKREANASKTPQPSAEALKTYQRARRRAAAEASFYLHLMWYGVIIGFLFFINLLTSPSFQWWLFPAIGWGFGVASHFVAVFGWRWVQERVFEPAIKREVEREVTKEKEVLYTEKQASLDELTATFAHEIRNPIAAAKSLVQQMGEDPTSVENVEYAKVALDELARVERSVSHLLKYAKEEDYTFDNVNLSAVLDGALTQMRSKLEANAVKVSRNYLTGPTVRADADKLKQVFSNMIDNAIDAMSTTTGEKLLELGIHRGRSGLATVIVRDNGCGIAQDKVSKIYNPFYTSKQNGTGLGLGVAKKVIDAHRGTIEVSSEIGAGTEFVISLPLADAARDANADATVALERPAAPTTAIAVNGNANSIPSETTIATASVASQRGQQ